MMVYEMKFEIDEPQFTQREMLGVIDLPATTVNTWLKRNLLDPFEFKRSFATEAERLKNLVSGAAQIETRTYRVFQHDPAVRRARLYSVLDCLCLAGIKAVLDANVEIRFAYQIPVLLCDLWTDLQLINLNRNSLFESPIVLYVDDGTLFALYPQPTERDGRDTLRTGRDRSPIDPKLNAADLLAQMRSAQLAAVTVIDWPAVEERVITRLKQIIGVRGHRIYPE
ncbi:MAG: hypothetical protein NTY38_03940 [Acidobacteria bacterium]|nr:hypothetical protein [Acidobacteriota bacterium]